MWIVFLADNLHEMLILIFYEKKKLRMFSAFAWGLKSQCLHTLVKYSVYSIIGQKELTASDQDLVCLPLILQFLDNRV